MKYSSTAIYNQRASKKKYNLTEVSVCTYLDICSASGNLGSTLGTLSGLQDIKFILSMKIISQTSNS
jgi:hypothetical protein